MKQDKTPTTVIEWLEKAKADGDYWADAAIANCADREQEAASFFEALVLAFNWRKSPQGRNYWLDVLKSLSSK